MILVVLRDLRLRLLLLVLVAGALYALEPGFHQHDAFTIEAIQLGPLGISATLSYFAGIAMIVLLAGFVANDRREGYTRLYFSHPTSPLAYYGLRWGIAYALALLGAATFLVVGQAVAWGVFLGGWRGLLLPAITALVYGGLMAFFSVVLPRGDAWLAFLLLALPSFFPQIVGVALGNVAPAVRQVVLTLLPPQAALADIWQGILLGRYPGPALIFAVTYGVIFLLAAVVILRLREWP
jgi:hypothetical protein